MSHHARTLLTGSLGVLAFDALAATAASGLGFNYGLATLGSWIIYAVVGHVAARDGGMQAAASAGALMGLVDATGGWAISWAIGPGRLPVGVLTPTRWLFTALIVALIGAALGALGALRVRPVDAQPDARRT